MSRQQTSTAFHKSKTLDNKYMLGDEIGKGAYGRVYKGLDLENGDFVAIKQVSLENIAQEDLNTIMEHLSAKKADQKKKKKQQLQRAANIVATKARYVENGSLANIIKPNKFGPFPESLVAVYIAQVLEGLVYLHEQGVIHRDIKGANILTTKEAFVETRLEDQSYLEEERDFDEGSMHEQNSYAVGIAWNGDGLNHTAVAQDEMEKYRTRSVQHEAKHAAIGKGLVKLADFGVATKLTEADVNTHSVVGTPYWMAPEVIEMSGVCAASDIWSVGCTVIELLTCVPPYYDLQPMPALFRIVQDERPPIPDSLSPAITDFLGQCFKKNASKRPDAKTLLSHPWIQNSRRVLQSSLRCSGTRRNIEENGSTKAETSNGDDQSTAGSPSAEKLKESNTEFLSAEAAETVKSSEDNGLSYKAVEERADNCKNGALSDQDPIHEKLPIQPRSSRPSANNEMADLTEVSEPSNLVAQENVLINGEIESPESRRKKIIVREVEGKGSSVLIEHSSFGSAPRIQDHSPQKVPKASVASGGNELSRFSDTPGDASLDDLFNTLDKNVEDQAAEASTSASFSHVDQGNEMVTDGGNHDLATKLRATIAQKQIENESGQTNGGDLLRLMMGVLKDDVIGIEGLGFDDKLPAENLFHLQAVEFSKLVFSLRPDEPDDIIVSACQKLTAFFHQRPEQKIVFITQHGLLPLMELLEVPRTRTLVICSVLQVLNQIIKDNSEFQENACLLGL
ncbi:hypothetical protein RJ639_035174, partial [Escallonia herrerae]